MEYWVFKGYYPFYFRRSGFGKPLTQQSNIPKPTLPMFHHSNIPIGASPKLASDFKRALKAKNTS
jgi:hypothetical protein